MLGVIKGLLVFAFFLHNMLIVCGITPQIVFGFFAIIFLLFKTIKNDIKLHWK